MKIVFICDGNTCRSPMAEGIFKKMVNDIDVSSAGFSTYSGEEASQNTILVCRKHDIDLTDFKTTNVKDVDFSDVDLVLTATWANKEKIKRFFPDINAHTIKEYGGCYSDMDINDPSNGGLGDYVVCYFEIKQSLEKILETHEELR